MSPAGRRSCASSGVNWIDLSGIASIKAPELFVHVEGCKNRFARPGRPDTAFAPRGSRVARQLLIEPRRVIPQGELASLTGLNPGYLSRVLAKLNEMGLVERQASGLRATDPDRLLDAWAQEYRFDKHRLIAGHFTPANRQSVAQIVADSCAKYDRRYALTGLAGAWVRTQFARYRLTTVYVDQAPSPALLDLIGFTPEPRGANLWLLVPQDEGVFDGGSVVDGMDCAHLVQIYLDLLAHPVRAREAAEELRTQLGWAEHG